MIDKIKKIPIFTTILVSVAVALIAGGTSPWWWKKYIVKSEAEGPKSNWFYIGSNPVWVHNGQPAFEY